MPTRTIPFFVMNIITIKVRKLDCLSDIVQTLIGQPLNITLMNVIDIKSLYTIEL
jgi:RNAse (barnase) inhibitor barstar